MSKETEELVMKVAGSMDNPKLQDVVEKLRFEARAPAKPMVWSLTALVTSTTLSARALLKETGFEIVSGQNFGLYIPFVSRFIGFLYQALGVYLPFPFILNIKVPEFLATNFFIECKKPEKKGE